MISLGESERSFLRAHKLRESDFFAIPGAAHSDKELGRDAKSKGFSFIVGSKCKKGGHRLRTRRGHCIQCDPSRIAHMSRAIGDAFVYVAVSREYRRVKIGWTESPDKRHRQSSLNKTGYGGIRDWKIVRFEAHPSAGKLEKVTLSRLNDFREDRSYRKGGKKQIAKEILTCTEADACNALDEAMQKLEQSP